MKFKKCFWCDKMLPTPYNVTEIYGESVESYDMCKKCAEEYFQTLEDVPKLEKPKTDLTSIGTPEELMSFIDSVASKAPQKAKKEPCTCGLTAEELEKNGRFNCVNCYRHFNEFMEKKVFPYHKAREHVGKRPRSQFLRAIKKDPVEKMKLLKLRFAKAIELEEYELAGQLNEEIKQLSPSTSSEDQ